MTLLVCQGEPVLILDISYMYMHNIGMLFEWDQEKAETNEQKHGVSFDEAKHVFLDPNYIEFYDEDHSTLDEPRFQAIGLVGMRMLFVIYTVRDNVIRIIHARIASSDMEVIYASQ